MSEQRATGQIKSAVLDVVVTRADGTVERHDGAAYYHKNPLRRLVWRLAGWKA